MPKAKRESVREVPFVLQTILPGACSQVEVRVEHNAITRPIVSCDDPVVKWAESPLTAPEKPIVAERV